MRFGVARARLQLGELLRPRIERREICGVARCERRQVVDRDVVFAPGGSRHSLEKLAAIKDADAVSTAIAVTVPADRFYRTKDELIKRVVAASSIPASI